MSTTSTTQQPKSTVELQKTKLGVGWASLSQALYNTWDAAISDREVYDRNLTIWNNFYERRAGVRNWPWKNASNIVVNIIPTQLDTMLADIVLDVYGIQRFYVVNGNTEQAASRQHDVEQYLNAELFRDRPGKSWIMQSVESTFAGLRDGNGITSIYYRKEIKKERVAIVERLTDPETGIDIINPETGKPFVRTTVEERDIPVYDDVMHETVEARNFGVIPAWQTDIDKAAATWERRWLDSTVLRGMCKSTANPDGPLQNEAVEFAISYLAAGESDLKNSRQGYSTYTIAGQIQIGQEEGTASPEMQQHVGPLEVIEMHSNQFFGGDEYVFWFHVQSQTCMGYQRYQYWHGQRPYSIKTPFPRIDRYYGISLVERLLPDVIEINANRNRRNDFLDQRTLPPMYELDGAKLLTKNNAWGPDARWKLPSKDAVGFIPMPDVSALLAGKEEEEIMRQDIMEFTGNSSVGMGVPSAGRKTAKEIQSVSARASLRHKFIAMFVRDADARTLHQTIQLKIQYGPDYHQIDTNIGGVPQRLQISKEDLAQDYTFSIAGSGGSLDKAAQSTEMQSVYMILMQNPLIAGDPVKIWGVTRMMLESYNRADILSLIGTRDEAEQQKKAQQMMAQMQAQQGGHAPPHGQHPAGHHGGHPAPHPGGFPA